MLLPIYWMINLFFYSKASNKLNKLNFPLTANLLTKTVLLLKKCPCRSVQQCPEITTAQQNLQSPLSFINLSWFGVSLLVPKCSFSPCPPDVLRLFQSPHSPHLCVTCVVFISEAWSGTLSMGAAVWLAEQWVSNIKAEYKHILADLQQIPSFLLIMVCKHA